MTVEEKWRQVLPWLSCTGEPVIEPAPEAIAAVRELVLEVVDEAHQGHIFHDSIGLCRCRELRARLEELVKGE